MKNYILTLLGIIAVIALIIACFCRAYENVYNTNPDNKWRVHDAVMISAIVVILLIMITAIL